MKKFLVLILILAMVFSLAACGSDPVEAPADEAHFFVASLHGHHLFVGHRPCRVLMSDSSQPHRLHRQRRSLHTHAAEGHSGGYHPSGLHHLLDPLLQGREPAMEPLCSILLPDCSRIFCLYEINRSKPSSTSTHRAAVPFSILDMAATTGTITRRERVSRGSLSLSPVQSHTADM